MGTIKKRTAVVRPYRPVDEGEEISIELGNPSSYLVDWKSAQPVPTLEALPQQPTSQAGKGEQPKLCLSRLRTINKDRLASYFGRFGNIMEIDLHMNSITMLYVQ